MSSTNACDHFARDRAGQTLNWTSTDDEKTFQENCQDPVQKSRLEQLGWLDPGAITYRHNSHGFRCPEFDQRPSGIALGASVTFGVGVPESQTWSQVLARSMGIHVWNLGVEGGALDTCFRVLKYYINQLNVEFVALVVPPTGRFELMSHHGRYQVFGMHMEPDRHFDYIKEWLVSDENAQLNSEKNIRAMRDLCHEQDIEFYFPGFDAFFPDDGGQARDLKHPGTTAHREFAEIVRQNLKRN